MQIKAKRMLMIRSREVRRAKIKGFLRQEVSVMEPVFTVDFRGIYRRENPLRRRSAQRRKQ